MKWTVMDCYDVWGNEKEGWEVNGVANIGEYEIAEDIIEDDSKLLKFLKDVVKILSTTDRRRLEVYGECGMIEVTERKTGMPLLYMLTTEV